MARNCLGARTQRHDTFEFRRLVFFIGYRAPVPVEIVLARTPSCGIPLSDDSMDAIWREKAIFDPLAQAVLIDRITEVQIRVAVFFARRSRSHAQLIRRLEPIE